MSDDVHVLNKQPAQSDGCNQLKGKNKSTNPMTNSDNPPVRSLTKAIRARCTAQQAHLGRDGAIFAAFPAADANSYAAAVPGPPDELML